jgi:hypothetical protein
MQYKACLDVCCVIVIRSSLSNSRKLGQIILEKYEKVHSAHLCHLFSVKSSGQLLFYVCFFVIVLKRDSDNVYLHT